MERWFAFTPDDANYRAAAAALDILLWPGASTPAEVSAASERFRQVVKIGGLLRIKTLDPGNLNAGARAWIDRMAFSVSIDFPH